MILVAVMEILRISSRRSEPPMMLPISLVQWLPSKRLNDMLVFDQDTYPDYTQNRSRAHDGLRALTTPILISNLIHLLRVYLVEGAINYRDLIVASHHEQSEGSGWIMSASVRRHKVLNLAAIVTPDWGLYCALVLARPLR